MSNINGYGDINNLYKPQQRVDKQKTDSHKVDSSGTELFGHVGNDDLFAFSNTIPQVNERFVNLTPSENSSINQNGVSQIATSNSDLAVTQAKNSDSEKASSFLALTANKTESPQAENSVDIKIFESVNQSAGSVQADNKKSNFNAGVLALTNKQSEDYERLQVSWNNVFEKQEALDAAKRDVINAENSIITAKNELTSAKANLGKNKSELEYYQSVYSSVDENEDSPFLNQQYLQIVNKYKNAMDIDAKSAEIDMAKANKELANIKVIQAQNDLKAAQAAYQETVKIYNLTTSALQAVSN